MKLHRHPGMILRRRLNARGLSVTDAAKLIGVGRPHLSNVLQGGYRVTDVMAVRLQRAGLGDAGRWLLLQLAHELSLVRWMTQDDGP